jgi:hypothetical protein
MWEGGDSRLRTNRGEGAASYAGNRRVRSKVNPAAGTEVVPKTNTPGENRPPIPLVLLKILSNEARRAGSVNLRGF